MTSSTSNDARDRGLFARLEAVVRDVAATVRELADRARVVEGSADPDNPTTDLDRIADEALHRGLLAAFDDPSAVGWLSEERPDGPGRLSAPQVIITDPIDGTRNLLKGIPESAISVALWRPDGIVWACVLNPFSGECFSATRGGGAWCDGRRLRVSACEAPSRALVVVSRHEEERGLLVEVSARVACRAVGSIAYKLALVAEGRAEGTLTVHDRREWDIAAGALLVAEAGGRMTDAAGDEVRFNRPDTRVRGVVASNGVLHAALLEVAGAARATSAG